MYYKKRRGHTRWNCDWSSDVCSSDLAAMFANSPEEYSPQSLRKLSYADAKEKVMELPGVGNKVADCILLFSCGFYEAFPVDVWIHRAVLGSYGSDIDVFMAAAKIKAKNQNE